MTRVEKALFMLAKEIEMLPYCDYQIVLMLEDILGIEKEKKPKFVD